MTLRPSAFAASPQASLERGDVNRLGLSALRFTFSFSLERCYSAGSSLARGRRRSSQLFLGHPSWRMGRILRHEEIRDPGGSCRIARSLWAVDLPETGYATPTLSTSVLTGDQATYPTCQAEAATLRGGGAERIAAPSAALLAGGARGWIADPHEQDAPAARDGIVWVLFGSAINLIGWPAVRSGAPPARVLPLVRHY